jgi:hypothetical protein
MSTPDAPHTPAGPPPPPASWPNADVPGTGGEAGAGVGPYALGDAVPGSAFAPAPPRRNGLALTAFVVGLVSILVCLIPLVNVLSVLGGLVAVVVAIVALRRLTPGVTGKGFAIAGLVLGAISAVVAALMLVGLAVAAQSFDSEEFEQLLEEVEAAEEAGVAGDGPQALPTGAPDDAPAQEEVSLEAGTDGVVREDFSGVTCDVLAEEAVLVSQSLDDGEADLVKIRESAVVEDHRADYLPPAGAEESLLLSCRGTAAWTDLSESAVLTQLTIDADGEVFVAYISE